MQLEIGFRTIKTKLDEGSIDYRQALFGLPAKDESEEDEFIQFYTDSRNAKPLSKESFIESIRAYVEDDEVREALAVGCQKFS